MLMDRDRYRRHETLVAPQLPLIHKHGREDTCERGTHPLDPLIAGFGLAGEGNPLWRCSLSPPLSRTTAALPPPWFPSASRLHGGVVEVDVAAGRRGQVKRHCASSSSRGRGPVGPSAHSAAAAALHAVKLPEERGSLVALRAAEVEQPVAEVLCLVELPLWWRPARQGG